MAEMSDFRRAPVGCVAVIGNKVVATGFSQHKTHPLQMYYNKFRDFSNQQDIEHKIHAETHLLAAAQHMPIDWTKVDVYVYRMCRSREHGMAKPCPACEKALAEAGVRNVYYTTDFGFDYIKIA